MKTKVEKHGVSAPSQVVPDQGIPLRVCMVSYYFPPHYSGSAVQAHNLCRHLQLSDVESLIVSANLTKSAAEEQIDGICVYRLPVVNWQNLRVATFWIGLTIFLFRHRRAFDVIHAHGTFQHGIVSLIGRLLGKRTILKIAMADSDIAFHRQGRVLGRLNRWLVRCFDIVIATSKAVSDECVAQGLRVSLIPNGVDTGQFDRAVSPSDRRDLRERLGLPAVPIVMFVGALNSRKNIDTILRVWRELCRRGVKGHLLLVGPLQTRPEGGLSEYCRGLQQFVAREGLAGSVTFTGQKSDIANYLRCADVFYFPSRQEGMPNALLEAMATALPVVASDISGTCELIQHGKNGYLLPVDNERSQTDALERLLNDSAASIEMGNAARRFVVANHSLLATAKAYRKLYLELLNPNSLGSPRHVRVDRQ